MMSDQQDCKPRWRHAFLDGVVRTVESDEPSFPRSTLDLPATGAVGFLRKFSALILGAAALLLFFFHIHNLSRVPPDWDEASISYFALQGHVHPWDETAPRGMRSFLQIYSSPEMPVYMVLERSLIRLLGLGVWQIRVAPILAALGSVAILCFLFCKTAHSYLCFALLWFASSYIFFICVHNARPDAFILLAGAVTLAWVYVRGGRVAGFFTGLLTGAVFGMHASVVLVMGTAALLITASDGARAWVRPPAVWWQIGLGSSLTAVLFLVDADQLAQWFCAALTAGNFSPPLLFGFHGNMWAIFCHVLYVLGSRLLDVNVLYTPLEASFFAVAIIQARRWHALSRIEQLLLVTAFGFTACYSVATGSTTTNYLLYVNVWYLFPMAWLLWRLARQEIKLDWTDTGILLGAHMMTCSAVFLGRSISAVAGGLLWQTSALSIVLYGRIARWIGRRWLRWGIPVLAIIVVLSFPSHRNLFPIWFRWMKLYHPDVLIGTALAWGLSVAIIHPVRDGVSWFWPTGPRSSLNKTVFAVLSVLMVASLMLDSLANAQIMRAGGRIPAFQREVASLQGEVVLGPAQIFLYDPSITFWSVIALQNAVWSMHVATAQQIERLRITCILWPEGDLSMLKVPNPSEWRRMGSHETPFGTFVEFRRHKDTGNRFFLGPAVPKKAL